MAEKKVGQKMRFGDGELGVIKSFFADNDELLFALRKLFLRFDLTNDEVKMLERLNSEDAIKVLRKIFLPEIEAYVPFGQNIDLWMLVDVKSKDPMQVFLEVLGRSKTIRLIEKGFERLKALDQAGDSSIASFIPVLVASNADELMTDLIARNTLISHVDQQLMQIQLLAGFKEETVEETKTRLRKDSTK